MLLSAYGLLEDVLGYTEHLYPLLSLLIDEFSSLHCTLLTLLPPRGLCDSHLIGSIGPGWVWCHGPADNPPLLLSASICLMDCGVLDRGPWLPTIHTLCHTHWMCCNSVIILLYTWHLLLPSILEKDPPLLLSWRFLLSYPHERVFFYFLGVFSDSMWGPGTGMS